jgi:hypothetical protein
MPNDENSGMSRPGSPQAKAGFWQRMKGAITGTEKEFKFLKGLTVVSLLGTMIGAYFQNLSSYQDKVSALAKDDMAAATAAFTETSNTLSKAITLQDLLFYDFARAAKLNASNDGSALASKDAHDLYKPYEDAFAALRENVNLLARNMELYVDWASDVSRDPATDTALGVDPISTSLLGVYNFDCDQDMPTFAKGKSTLHKVRNGNTLDVDWYSTKHHVLTIEYCFDVTHKTWMEIVRQWASQSSLDQKNITTFFSDGTAARLQARLDSEVVRLNAYMSRAMNEIEQIRVKYRPNGFLCSVPVVREIIGRRCMPVRTATG